MSTTTPTWTDAASALVAAQILAPAKVSRTELDLSGKVGAYVVACVGRTHTTAITSNWFFRIRRMVLNEAKSQPGGPINYTGAAAAASIATVQDTTVASNLTTIPMTSTPTGLGTQDKAICFTGHSQPSGLTQGVTVPAEFCRLVAAWSNTNTSAGTTIWVDAPTTVTKVASEVVSNSAEIIGPLWLPGGARYEVIFDYAAATAGENLVIAAYYQTYDSDDTV